MVDYPQEGRIVELFALAGGGYGVKLTQVRPDPNDPITARALRLSIWEEDCSSAAVLGGPMSSGPYDQARLSTVVTNVADAAQGDYCPGNVEGANPGPQGGPLDRNTILLP